MSCCGISKRVADEDDNTSFFDTSLEILSNYRETGMPVPTYWEALGLIKQKTTHEAYWFCGANDEDRLCWLMRLTPNESMQAFQDWKRKIKKESETEDVDTPSFINLKVNGQIIEYDVYYKMNARAKLEKLMQAYCVRLNLSFLDVTFLFDGRKLREEQTPYEVGMKNGDEIYAVLHQDG